MFSAEKRDPPLFLPNLGGVLLDYIADVMAPR